MQRDKEQQAYMDVLHALSVALYSEHIVIYGNNSRVWTEMTDDWTRAIYIKRPLNPQLVRACRFYGESLVKILHVELYIK